MNTWQLLEKLTTAPQHLFKCEVKCSEGERERDKDNERLSNLMFRSGVKSPHRGTLTSCLSTWPRFGWFRVVEPSGFHYHDWHLLVRSFLSVNGRKSNFFVDHQHHRRPRWGAAEDLRNRPSQVLNSSIALANILRLSRDISQLLHNDFVLKRSQRSIEEQQPFGQTKIFTSFYVAN
jgi:hypothetical protein